MIEKLEISNSRCFTTHSVELHPTTLIVGRNNAGKSTIIEALRLIALVENRYKSLRFTPPPRWLEMSARTRGVAPSLSGYDINLDTLFHRYGDPPARLTATFARGDK